MARYKQKQKKAQHASYLRNKEKVYNRTKQTRAKWREIVAKLKNKPCMDCEIQYPYYVMHFDHRPGEIKINTVSVLLQLRGLPMALAEIKKCDLVCGNCHAMRTWKRRQAFLTQR